MECPEPPKKPKCPVFENFNLFEEDGLPISARRRDAAWLLARNSCWSYNEDGLQDVIPSSDVPVWSAYNSLLNEPLPTTRSAAPPLIASPAHEWNTLLTVLMQVRIRQICATR